MVPRVGASTIIFRLPSSMKSDTTIEIRIGSVEDFKTTEVGAGHQTRLIAKAYGTPTGKTSAAAMDFMYRLIRRTPTFSMRSPRTGVSGDSILSPANVFLSHRSPVSSSMRVHAPRETTTERTSPTWRIVNTDTIGTHRCSFLPMTAARCTSAVRCS